MKHHRLLSYCGAFAVCVATNCSIGSAADVAIYGATPAGIAAAIAAAKSGCTVDLIEPTGRIGGLVASGLSHADFHSFASLSGSFLDFSQRVAGEYAAKYGKDSDQTRDSFRGVFGEPHVNLSVFQRMIAEQPRISLRSNSTLVSVATADESNRTRIVSATFRAADGAISSVAATVYVDATYEGDLLAMAGVPWRVGREGKSEYGESLAPEQPDQQLQAYNFRLIMTRDPANRVSPSPPAGYRRDDFVDVLPMLDPGPIKSIFGAKPGSIYKAQQPPLPNGKYDINDMSGGQVRLSLPGANLGWPTGDAAERAKIFAFHLRDQTGLLYFLQNDDAVPKKLRDEAREWGWCKDEFGDSNHLPPQLYVREARRMFGMYVFAQRDSEHADNDARAVLHVDSIAIGDYGNNCHGTGHEGSRFSGKHTGEFYNPVPPYQVPYGVMAPRRCENLLVPVAVSSTHVGFCALRLEPIWMSLGQAAGHAAAMAVRDKVAVQKISVSRLQRALHADRSATIYFSDVAPDSPDFAVAQWWGTIGGFHGLEPMPVKRGQRGANIVGQYFEANPGHAAGLDRPLEDALVERWRRVALGAGIAEQRIPERREGDTRGSWLRALAATSEDLYGASKKQ